MTIPGLVYEKLRNTFPIRRQAARVAVGIPTSLEDTSPQFGTIPLMQFLRKDEKALMQIGSHLLSINVLKPYPSWQKFLPLIEKGVNTYRDVAAPKGFQRIGLRYINRIEIADQNINLEEARHRLSDKWSISVSKDATAHSQVRKEYKKRNCMSIAVGLDRMRIDRNRADYEDGVVNLTVAAEENLRRASQVVSALSKL